MKESEEEKRRKRKIERVGKGKERRDTVIRLESKGIEEGRRKDMKN